MQIFKGNVNDSKILQQQMDTIIENKDYVNYLFADKGYCSKITRDIPCIFKIKGRVTP